jgi:hypothetical protein
VSSINGGQLAGLRNLIINGGMQTYQRGSIVATTSGAYTLDRWFVTPTGASVTVTQSTSSPPTGFSAYLNVAGAASVTNCTIYQRIESVNCVNLTNGSTVTVSGYIYQSTGSSVSTATISLYAATSQDSTYTTLAATAYTIPSIATGTWTKFSNTFTLTSACTNGVEVLLTLGGSLTTGILGLTGVQLEAGSQATPFEWRSYGVELDLCLRYYEMVPSMAYRNSNGTVKAGNSIVGNMVGILIGATGTGTATAGHGLTYLESKRAAPTMTFSTRTTSYTNSVETYGGTTTYTALDTTTSSFNVYAFQVTSAGGAQSYLYFGYEASAEL